MSPRNLVLVVLWMTGALLSFCLMAVAFRKLAETLSIMEILATRNGLGLTVMVTLLILRPELRPLVRSRSSSPRRHGRCCSPSRCWVSA